jgi:aspartate aminotransferase
MISKRVSKRLASMTESATLAMAKKSRALKAQGIDVVDMSLGEPDFDTPDYIKNAAKKALDEGFTSYTPVVGYLDLRNAICKKFERDNALHFSPEQIVVSTGAKQSLANLMMALLNEGDEVLIPSPFWVSYSEMVKLGDANPVFVYSSIENDFKVTAEQVKQAITPKTRMFLFSSPCNPSGSVYSYEELQAIANVLSQHDIIIVSDEIYEHINFSGKPHVSIGAFENVKDQTVTVNGLSKAFAMTGWRLGYIGAPLWIAQACDKIQGQITSGTNSIAQRAAITALGDDISPTRNMVKKFHERRDLIVSLFQQIPNVKCNNPEGAFYIFPDISAFFGKRFNGKEIKDADELSIYLLEESHVSTVSGAAFGNPECIRLSYATSNEKIILAAERIKNALALLS